MERNSLFSLVYPWSNFLCVPAAFIQINFSTSFLTYGMTEWFWWICIAYPSTVIQSARQCYKNEFRTGFLSTMKESKLVHFHLWLCVCVCVCFLVVINCVWQPVFSSFSLQLETSVFHLNLRAIGDPSQDTCTSAHSQKRTHTCTRSHIHTHTHTDRTCTRRHRAAVCH